MRLPPRILLLALCSLVPACTVLPSREVALVEYRNAQKAAARQAEQEGRLLEALNLWRSLLPLDAGGDEDVGNTEIHDAIMSLEKQIQARTSRSLRNGKLAYSRGDDSSGDTWMLKVLALHPEQKEALAALRLSASKRAEAQQAAKGEEEYRAVIARQRQREPAKSIWPDYQVRSLYEAGKFEAVLKLGSRAAGELGEEFPLLLRSSHIALADQAKGNKEYDLELHHLQAAMTAHSVHDDPLIGRCDRLRIMLSKKWYRMGNGLMKDDLRGAIAALEKSVGYYPGNSAAKIKLKQAKTMQRNLEKIQRQ